MQIFFKKMQPRQYLIKEMDVSASISSYFKLASLFQ